MFRTLRPAASEPDLQLEPSPSCARCGGTVRLVLGDGAVICWPCAMAWGWFARLVTAGPTAAEPVMVDTCRAGHHRPKSGCPWCIGRRDHIGSGPVA